jgi:hypothetical protein
MLTRHQQFILNYYEKIVARDDKERETMHESIKSHIYWRDHVPHRHILRMVRLRNDLPVCSGAVDCLETSLGKCSGGEHTTCHVHKASCYLCKAEDATNEL